jgi:hypothetical protein
MSGAVCLTKMLIDAGHIPLKYFKYETLCNDVGMIISLLVNSTAQPR